MYSTPSLVVAAPCIQENLAGFLQLVGVTLTAAEHKEYRNRKKKKEKPPSITNGDTASSDMFILSSYADANPRSSFPHTSLAKERAQSRGAPARRRWPIPIRAVFAKP
jgi:hypothetical protein